MPSLRVLHIQSENLAERLFSRQGYRVTDLQRRARLREMRRWNRYVATLGQTSGRPYPDSEFAKVRAEMGEAR